MNAGAPTAARPLDLRALGLLGLGHLSADFCQGALPAMLPFLVAERHLSYVLAAALVLGQTVASSIVQPLFGRLSDGRSLSWLMPAGLLVAGVGLGLAPVAGAYPVTWCLVVLSGLGIAAFHPEGARFARRASGTRLTSGMSLFSAGGNLGFAFGPFVATPLLLWGGLRAGWLLGIFPLALGLVLLAARHRVGGPSEAATRVAPGATSRDSSPEVRSPDRWGPFGRLTVALVVRSIVFYALNTFIPLFWIDVLHQSTGAGGTALTLMLLVGAGSTLLAGRLGDRYSRRGVALVGFAGMAPLVALLTLSHDPLLSLALLVPVSLALYLPSSPMVVMGQEYLPRHVGTASGVTLGLAVSVGGIVTPVVGAAAQAVGLRHALLALAVLPLLAVALVATLPREGRRAAPAT